MKCSMTVSHRPYASCSPPTHPRRVQLRRSSVGVRDHSWRPKLVLYGPRNLPSVNLRCSGTGDSGENESRTILDAFFLGKAVAEAVNERVESAVGEFLSAVGRLQAEQQKQVQEFQEDVLERARRAKEQAARDAMEGRGLIPEAATDGGSSTINGVPAAASSSASGSATSFPESKPGNEDISNMD